MSKFGIRVLTPPYQILIELHEHGWSTSGDLLANCQLTPATFQKYLADLLARGLVWWEKDPGDGRRRRYSLTEGTRAVLNEELKFAVRWQIHSTEPERSFEHFLCRMRARLGIRLLSNEFNVLVMLYDKGQLTTGQLLSFNGASAGVFYITLRRLTDLKHIRELSVPGDGRQKLHQLTERSQVLMEQLHREMSEWAARLP